MTKWPKLIVAWYKTTWVYHLTVVEMHRLSPRKQFHAQMCLGFAIVFFLMLVDLGIDRIFNPVLDLEALDYYSGVIVDFNEQTKYCPNRQYLDLKLSSGEVKRFYLCLHDVKKRDIVGRQAEVRSQVMVNIFGWRARANQLMIDGDLWVDYKKIKAGYQSFRGISMPLIVMSSFISFVLFVIFMIIIRSKKEDEDEASA